MLSIEELEALERDEDGLTEGQRERIAHDVRGIKANGWVAIMDGVASELGVSRSDVLLLWIFFLRDRGDETYRKQAEEANKIREEQRALFARLDPILRDLEKRLGRTRWQKVKAWFR